MDILPHITVPIKSESYQSVLKDSAFKPGSTLMLKVVELQGDRALIDFGKFQASAVIKIPVRLGQELSVRVQESGKQLKLALMNTGPPKTGASEFLPQMSQSARDQSYHQIQTELKQVLNHILKSPNPQMSSKQILNIFSMLNSHFESFNLEKMAADIMPRLKSYVDNSGFFFERILETKILNLKNEANTAGPRQLAQHPDIQAVISRDLKANLLAMKSNATAEGALQKGFDIRSLAILRNAIDFLLSDITSQQGRAVQQFDAPDPFQVFTYTLPLSEEKQSAKLKVYYQKKQRTGSKNGFQISLLLSMDRLGDLRTDFYLLEKDLTITFFVKDRITQDKIQKNYQTLTEFLDPLFDQVLLRVIVSEAKIKNFEQQDFPKNNDKRVDLRI